MPVVLNLDINKLMTSLYEARCDGSPEPSTTHESITAVLRHYGADIPANFSRFVNVSYCGVSCGTQPITRLALEAEVMARELVELAAEVQRSLSWPGPSVVYPMRPV